MKRLALTVGIALIVLVGSREFDVYQVPTATSSSSIASADTQLRSAFTNQVSDLQVQGDGEVVKVLSDDNDGSRHQRFILRTSSGQSLLVAHNIDLANRIDDLKAGDRVEFNGEYEWNAKGGVIHWTHRDPKGRHEPGWIKHKGRTYQ